MPRSRADERLLARIRKEAPEALDDDAKADVAGAVDRLLKTKPQSREERRAAKTKAAPTAK